MLMESINLYLEDLNSQREHPAARDSTNDHPVHLLSTIVPGISELLQASILT